MTSVLARISHFASARLQEAAIAADDLRYALLNGGAVAGWATGVEDLGALAAARWGAKATQPLHVAYLGAPSIWEVHNLPADPGLEGVVTTIWLRDLGFGEDYVGGALRRRAEVGPAIHEALRRLDAARPVHLVIAYLAGAHVLPEHVRAWSDLGLVTSAFHLDDRLYFRGRRLDGLYAGPADTCRAFDLNLTNVRRSLTKYAAVGARALFWPEAANPAFFRPLELERTHDVAFLGGRYGPRGAVVERLAKDGFSVLARGPGWTEGPVSSAEVPEIFQRGQVVLGFSGIGRSHRATCLKGRDFEAPMSGAAYFPSWNPELPYVYEVSREVHPWRSYRDLRSGLHSLLASPEKLNALREAGRARALRDHTWARRVESIARVLGHPWRAPPAEPS